MVLLLSIGIYALGYLLTRSYEYDIKMLTQMYKPKFINWVFWPFTIYTIRKRWLKVISKF